MDGVTILATEQVASSFSFNWWACLIGFIIFGVFTIAIGLAHDMLGDAIIYILAGIFGIVAGVIAGFAFGIPTEYETQYKVTVTSDVSMAEFYEHYEVVEQEGLIFTVKEKNYG